MSKTDNKAPPPGTSVAFVKSFRHWRSGKLIRAEDYGLKGFPIRRKRK